MYVCSGNTTPCGIGLVLDGTGDSAIRGNTELDGTRECVRDYYFTSTRRRRRPSLPLPPPMLLAYLLCTFGIHITHSADGANCCLLGCVRVWHLNLAIRCAWLQSDRKRIHAFNTMEGILSRLSIDRIGHSASLMCDVMYDARAHAFRVKPCSDSWMGTV